MRGFHGASFDGRFIYFVPYYDGSTYSGKMLAYDTHESFKSSASWSGLDVSGVPPGTMKGFGGSVSIRTGSIYARFCERPSPLEFWLPGPYTDRSRDTGGTLRRNSSQLLTSVSNTTIQISS